MTPSNVSPQEDEVVAEIEIAAPPERVFRALTDQKELFTWWGSEPSVELTAFDMDARRGGRYQYRCKPKPGADFGPVQEQLEKNGVTEFETHGEIVEIDPPRLLVWTWIANWHEHPTRPTTVRWELTPTRAGTRVRVTHSGLAQEPISRKDYGSGWQGVLRLLEAFLQKR
jgi:uncharacterized protein YndB with AHSA1/START domain